MPRLAKASKDTKTKPTKGEERLNWIRATVLAIVPTAVETASYGIPTFDVDGKHLVHAAVYNHHLGFYPTPAVLLHFKKRLTNYVHAKGSVQFRHDEPFPKPLIQSMIRFRARLLRESRQKA